MMKCSNRNALTATHPPHQRKVLLCKKASLPRQDGNPMFEEPKQGREENVKAKAWSQTGLGARPSLRFILVLSIVARTE